jgi:hypothetical protein
MRGEVHVPVSSVASRVRYLAGELREADELEMTTGEIFVSI